MGLTKPRAAQIFNLDYKQSTRVVTATNITLTGGAPNLVDGITLSLGDRVLVTGQTTGSQNGLYLVTTLGSGANGTWARTSDGNENGEIEAGMIVMVTEGTIYADTQWKLITDDPIVIGTTALTFTQNYLANSISGGTSNVVVNSNANVTISSAGTANVLTVSNTGAFVSGVVSATGNVTGNYILGNGALLTGVITSVANINNGTSNVTVVSSGGNVTVGVGGTGNVAVFANTGLVVTGVVSATGNVTGGNMLTAGLISATSTITSAANVVGGNITTAGLITATGNVTGGNVLTAGLISATSTITSAANITSANFLTTGLVSATGNITGGNVNTVALRSGAGALTISTGSGAINLQPAGGNIVLSANTYINNVAQPLQNQDAATKLYVDNAVSTAISYHQPVLAATTTTLATSTGGTITYTQPNGASNGVGALLTTTGSFNLIDTANVQTLGTRILVKNEANAVFNGVYTWANATNIVRATDADTAGVGNTSALGLNDYFFVSSGNVNLGSAFIVSAPTTAIVFGTSNISFAQFSQSQVYTANTAAGISLAGTVINAKVDGVTTAFDGGGNISVKASANLTTPNIGAATGTSLSVTGNVDAGNIRTAGLITATGNITGGNITTAGVVTATGNVVGGNMLTAGLISATSTITSAANITGGNLLTGGVITATGNVTGSNVLTAGIMSSAGNGIHGNILTGGLVSSTGNITTAGNISAVGTIYSNGAVNSTAFAVGNSAVSNVALGMFPTAGTSGEYAIRDYSSVFSHMYFDVGIGGTANGAFQFRSSNAFRLFANINSSGITTPLAVSATGNVTGSFFIGNGSQLTGIVASAGTSLINGTSNVVVAASGNVTVGVAGTATVATFTTAGLVANSVAATNNGAGTNFKVGDDTWLGDINLADTLSIRGQQNAANAYIVFGNADGTQLGRAGSGPLAYGGAFSALGNVTGGNLLTAGLITATANITGGNILTAGIMSSTGNGIHGNVLTAGLISATSTITSAANVAGLNITTSGNVVATGNVSGGNVAASTTVFSFGTVQGIGNVSGGNLLTAGLITATANITGGNILTVGQVSATGNVSGNFFIGNGAFLTGLSAGSSNGISNGATSISIPVASGNIAMSVAGQANTVVINLGSLTMYGTLAGPKILAANVAVANAVNAVLFGPVTVSDGFNITVPDASTLYTYSGA